MQRVIRRNDHEPRMEMMPMIDVIFLLLTFFIYSLLVMAPTQVLPVTLTSVGSQQQGTEAQSHAITIDRDGLYFLNRQQVAPDQLDQSLLKLAGDKSATLYLAVESQGNVDRGPILVNLIERVQRAGIKRFVIVGQPKEQAKEQSGG
jgi:biopolymer transport protein ExbD